MSRSGWGFAMVILAVGCRGKAEAAAEAARPVAAALASSTAAPSAPAPQELLDRIDTRTPVPLLPMMAHHQKQNMRDHLAAVQQIVAALAVSDFVTVEKAASRIGFSESMGRMCSHMGAGAPGFTETALKFHHGADEITKAARARDPQAVLSQLGQTLSQCTGCHEQYKQHIVDESAWSAAAGGAQAPQHRVD